MSKHLILLVSLVLASTASAANITASHKEANALLLANLDAPLLFLKRHNYKDIHIYDVQYRGQAGGGIYVLENPADPPEKHRIRAVIDAKTVGSPGEGIYDDPELSWDAKRVLFTFRKEQGNTSIYEIGVDGRNLRRVTDPSPACKSYCGSMQKGHGGDTAHDLCPAYLPDGRIVFKSTRRNGLVPCANSAADILHVMNADGSDIHTISVNNVNEFDPAILHDGRILYGRWEYVDKSGLTVQSLWVVNPDGSNETSIFANNMVLPEALLDARPVPGSSHLIVATLAKHNSTPRGTVAYIDPELGKNNPKAIFNFDAPNQPTKDMGDSCDPWPISSDAVIYSTKIAQRNGIIIAHRDGRRATVLSDAGIDLHNPMLAKQRPVPPVLPDMTTRDKTTGAFLVQDVYNGLKGIPRGTVKWLRVIQETSRTSASHGYKFNQTHLISGALGYSVKVFLGVVPVEEDGSAYFQAPSGRAIYFQAIDGDGRLVQSMRTFIQAAPGTVRACLGCHEDKNTAPPAPPVKGRVTALRRPPSELQDESWGSGYVDYATRVQPIFDRHCVRCHGGKDGITAGLDLSGGWTQYFNISYENLINRKRSVVTADLIAGIDCQNHTSEWSVPIFPPRTHGSGAAPLAKIIMSGHGGHIANLTRPERDLIFAWIDSNGVYHGNWDAAAGPARLADWRAGGSAGLANWDQMKHQLNKAMIGAGCMKCHGNAQGGFVRWENDWVNLREPEFSRILRAPLAAGSGGYGLGLCRDTLVDPKRQRLRIDVGPISPMPPLPANAKPLATFRSADDAGYQALLKIIRETRTASLVNPRRDMPGARVRPGSFWQIIPTPLPKTMRPLTVEVGADGVPFLQWEQSSRTIGLTFEVHRGTERNFVPSERTLIHTTTLFEYRDGQRASDQVHYALVLRSGSETGAVIRTALPAP